MKKHIITASIITLSVFSNTSAQINSNVWNPDLGNGSYMNPIINADYSDPDVCATSNGFYLTASSFNCTPGLPILHSYDLVNWEIVNHAVKKLVPEDFYATPKHGKGVWAPSIREHDGVFYIFWGDPDHGVFMVKTDNPRNDWEEPVLVWKGKGIIDATPLWDEDGKAYLINAWAASRSGMNSILTISEMNKECTKTITNPVLVYDGNMDGNHTVEGPKLYKRNGYYYILAPAGGVAQGWQIALRSKSIYGPYESKTVMKQGNSIFNGPHQGGLVDDEKGKSWFINFQDKGVYGRVLHLNPVEWKDGWPVMGNDVDGDGCGYPVSSFTKPGTKVKTKSYNPQDSDEFNSAKLGLQWQWNANYSPEFGFASANGFFRLYSDINHDNLWDVANLLLQKFPAEEFVATAKVTVSANANTQQSGIVVMGKDYCQLGAELKDGKFIINQTIGKDADNDSFKKNVYTIATIENPVKYNAGALDNYKLDLYLRVSVGKGGICRFSYSTDGEKFTNTLSAFTAKEGKWIGAKIGFFSSTNNQQRGWMDIDWIRFSKPEKLSLSLLENQGTRLSLPAIFNPEEELYYCNKKVQKTLSELQDKDGLIDYTMTPRNIMNGKKEWKLNKTTPDEWCAGFWPGVLWYDYENTGDTTILKEASNFTEALGYLAYKPIFDHDLGFIMIGSFENGYRLTGNSEYKRTLLAAADSLATLYNPKVGTILSWPRNVGIFGGHNTIMDNMINLELLFWAADNGGDKRLHDIAVKHAETTMKYHFREDYTSFHVAVYDANTGKFLRACTHQGYSDESMWARGQAWAVYGYTMVYKWTKDKKFLDFAQKVTDVYINRLPNDLIPYWDFNDPNIPNAPKDASAACVVASALIELSQFVEDKAKAEYYREKAVDMLKALSSKRYQSGSQNPAFLNHSVGNMPAGSEIDASIIYADYYYIEALTRLKKLKK